MHACCVVLWYKGQASRVKCVSNRPERCPRESQLIAKGHSRSFVLIRVLARTLESWDLPISPPAPRPTMDWCLMPLPGPTRFTGDLLVLLLLSAVNMRMKIEIITLEAVPCTSYFTQIFNRPVSDSVSLVAFVCSWSSLLPLRVCSFRFPLAVVFVGPFTSVSTSLSESDKSPSSSLFITKSVKQAKSQCENFFFSWNSDVFTSSFIYTLSLGSSLLFPNAGSCENTSRWSLGRSASVRSSRRFLLLMLRLRGRRTIGGFRIRAAFRRAWRSRASRAALGAGRALGFMLLLLLFLLLLLLLLFDHQRWIKKRKMDWNWLYEISISAD